MSSVPSRTLSPTTEDGCFVPHFWFREDKAGQSEIDIVRIYLIPGTRKPYRPEENTASANIEPRAVDQGVGCVQPWPRSLSLSVGHGPGIRKSVTKRLLPSAGANLY
jgi:hypothetical protein